MSTAAIVIGLVFLIIVLAFTDVRNLSPRREPWLIVLGIVGLLFILGGAIVKARAIRASLAKRQTAIGANVAVMTVLAILLAILVINISERRFVRIDMTVNRRYSLSSTAVRYLRRLDRPVHATVLYNPKSRLAFALAPMIEDTLSEFRSHSKYLTVEKIDIFDPTNKEALAALDARMKGSKVSSENCVVFECADRFKVVTFQECIETTPWARGSKPRYKAEDVFTSTLYGLIEGRVKLLYAVTGHGERPLKSGPSVDMANPEKRQGNAVQEQFTLSRFCSQLRQDNYRIEPLSLKGIDAIPECAALIIAGPKTPYTPEEMKLLEKYLDANGRMLVMVDADVYTGTKSNVKDLLKQYGIEARTDVFGSKVYRFLSGRGIFDLTGVPTVRMAVHPVTTDLQNFEIDFFRCCALVVSPEGGRPDLRVIPILFGDPRVWGETDTKVQYDPGVDMKGPLILAAVVQPKALAISADAPPPVKTPPGPRMVVFASSFPFTNLYLDISPTPLLLARNAVNWMTGGEAKLGIPPKNFDVREARVSKMTGRIARWLSIGIVPLIIITLGIFVWQVRRIH